MTEGPAGPWTAFDLVHTETGQRLYTTWATTPEIEQANHNLRLRGCPYTFHPTTTSSPS
jgi:hypothetical protein